MKAFVISAVVLSVIKVGYVVASPPATDEEAAAGCVAMTVNFAVAAWGVYLLFSAR